MSRRLPRTALLLPAAVCCRGYVLFGSFGCVMEGVQFMAVRQMRLMPGRHHLRRLVKLGGFSVMSGCVLVMFGCKFVKFGQR